MLRPLMGKSDNMQEHMGNISRKLENLRKNQREMVKIENKRNEESL